MTFVSELDAALETPNRLDAMNRVHELVARALHRLEPRAEVKHTDYFTHSFVPDLVMRWGTGEDRQERHVYLRFSVVRPVFARDLRNLAADAPLFIGMTDTADLREPSWRQHDGATNVRGSLVTQGVAVDEFDDGLRRDSRTRSATGPIVRAGHGLVDQGEASSLTSKFISAAESAADAGTADLRGAQARISEALDALNDVLSESEHLDVERSLQSEWIRHGGDPYEFPSSTPWNAELLDRETLRTVLLGLLETERPVAPETWQRNAGFIRAEEIGEILGRPLRGAAFNGMAHALLPNWTAKWVWAERTESPSLFPGYEWIVENGRLGIEGRDLRTFFADDGRHFKDKEARYQLPLLREARGMLSHAGLQQVGLRSSREGIRYEPLGQSAQVYDRLQGILSEPTSSRYRIVSLEAQVPGTDVVADIDLERQVIDLKGQSAPVAALARLASRSFSRAEPPDALDHFLATGQVLDNETYGGLEAGAG